jgi:hypothetical protein
VARVFAWVIVAFSFLTAAQARDAAWWFFEPDGKLWCGNVVSDPLSFNFNLLMPLAAGSALAMTRLCVASGRWPLLCQFSIVLLVLTFAFLLVATRGLTVDYGLPVGRIWWLPTFARRWLWGR